jgi:acyl-ACP thioesterase
MDIRQETFTVKTYDCQSDGSIKVSSLMNYLQEAAAVHAEQLGFGFARLNEIDSYWVLSNIKIEFTKWPKWNETITLRTWPSGHTRSIATREFIGMNSAGGELFKAGSEWMVLNKGSKRPRNLSRLDLNLLHTGPQTISANLKRLQPQETYAKTERLRVHYSSIDLNGHVNNAEYIRWAVDALKSAFAFAGPLRCLQATYFREVFEGDDLDLLLAAEANGGFHVLGRNPKDQTNVFAVLICA